jgi:acetyltransferase
MGTRALNRILAPQSIALIGASPREGSTGLALYRNIVGAGFKGEISLVNPRYPDVDGRACVSRLSELDKIPDAVVVAAPWEHALQQIDEAEKLGVGGAIVMTRDEQGSGGPLEQGLRAVARRGRMRIIGPDCLGVMIPLVGLNASLSAHGAPAGDLALLSQSGAIGSAMIAWAQTHHVGFSGLVSAGEMADVDFGDLLDYFALDPATRAILLYIDRLDDPQTFMSAARAAARVKPVIVAKSGRHKRGPKGGSSVANMAGPDTVYDAAFRRAGLLRVADIDELFDAAEALGRIKPFPGRRLAIISNGGGLGRLAADRLHDMRGSLAPLEPATWEKLESVLPASSRRENPLDLDGDADADRFKAAVGVALADKTTDAIMVMHAPNARSNAAEAAGAVVDSVKDARKRAATPKPVFAVWFGATPETDRIFEDARIPHYQTGAVRGFMHMVRWNEAREFMMSAPPNLPTDFEPDVERARSVVKQAIERGHRWLAPVEMTALLDAYDIPVAPARFARTPEEAGELARLFIARSGSCVVKIVSRDIAHKSDIGGVALELRTPDAAVEAAREMMTRIGRELPHATIEGVTVHPMIKRPHGRELIAGIADDPTFGPVIVFGRGGKAVEIIDDRAVTLPPLDLSLANDLIRRTRVANILEDYRDVPRADIDAVALTLVKLAQLSADIPEVRELDLNPLLADERGVMVVDARIRVEADPKQRAGRPNRRFAVAPYPKDLERTIQLKDGTDVLLRPVRPEDEDMYRAFFETVPQNDLRLRFFAPVKSFSHAFLARLTQIDYARSYAIAAVKVETGELLGGVRLMMNADLTEGEYAILLGPSMKGKGLGWRLMQTMIDYGRSVGLDHIEGQVLSENQPMLQMCKALGFKLRESREEPGVTVAILDLKAEQQETLANR